MYASWHRWTQARAAAQTHARNLEVAKEYNSLMLQHRAFHGWFRQAQNMHDGDDLELTSVDRELLATRFYKP